MSISPAMRASVLNPAGPDAAAPTSATPSLTPLPQPLGDCVVLHEQVQGRTLLRIVDPHMRTLGYGLQLDRAVQMALRARQANDQTPQRYSARLAGCSFRRDSDERGHARFLVLDAYGRVLAAHADQDQACRDAERELLRYEPATELSMQEFAKLCTTLTVEVVRGASGRAKSGEPRLQHLDSLSGLREVLARQYRRRAPEFGQEAHLCAVPLGVLNARTDAFLREHVFDTETLQVHPVELDGEYVVLRTPQAPPAARCVVMAHNYLIALAHQERLAKAGASRADARHHSHSRASRPRG